MSNANSWTYFVTDQGARTVYDYVDDHFYVDHPQFLEQSWRLPSRCPNTSPIADGATGGRSKAFTRLFNKPFTITEYNYSGPGRFRGVGGILTGALGAIQGWDGIWRFAYSHSREAMFKPSRMGYFDLASDPLSQAAERASLCLFLRGDLPTATNRVALTMTEADLATPAARIPRLAPALALACLDHPHRHRYRGLARRRQRPFHPARLANARLGLSGRQHAGRRSLSSRGCPALANHP